MSRQDLSEGYAAPWRDHVWDRGFYAEEWAVLSPEVRDLRRALVSFLDAITSRRSRAVERLSRCSVSCQRSIYTVLKHINTHPERSATPVSKAATIMMLKTKTFLVKTTGAALRSSLSYLYVLRPSSSFCERYSMLMRTFSHPSVSKQYKLRCYGIRLSSGTIFAAEAREQARTFGRVEGLMPLRGVDVRR